MAQIVPGGANSNARVGSSIAVRRACGADLFDMDGNRFVDYILGFGSVLLGHAHPVVTEAVAKAIERGTSFAFSHELELLVAERIVSMCPSVEMVRLCNSGSDAALTAYHIACAATGRRLIV